MKRRVQLRGLFSLLLACLWITTASFAEHVSAEFPLCQPERLPCCPPQTNNTSNTKESCPACRVSGATFVVKETSEQYRPTAAVAVWSGWDDESKLRVVAGVRELTRGLRFHPAVFDLKDDLRI